MLESVRDVAGIMVILWAGIAVERYEFSSPKGWLRMAGVAFFCWIGLELIEMGGV